MLRLSAFAVSMAVASAVKMPTLDATVGCKNGATYSGSASYGVSYSQWGHLPRGGWRGAVLGPNGDKIYGIPTNASQVLEIDPRTRTVSTFGNLGDVHSTKECEGTLHCGEEKWIGGVLMPSTGKIIAIPYAAETVLEIDPATRTTSTFGIVSSSVRRKWVDGVLGRNGLVYAIPYDADVVLEINPETRALMLFGRVGADPCKWYGGVLGPNDKIYAIPYSSPYVLEIDTERRIARPFAMTFPHWGKWSGGVLAPNGRIYAMPALAKSVLEIDVEREQTSLFGMLPGGEDLQDKWSGGVLAPNGRIYGMPWRADKVLEFDPATKALALLGTSLGASNFSWGGGVVAKSGRIVTVPYNGAWILEIGESVCVPSHPASDPNQQQLPPPVVLPTNLGGGDAIHHGPVMPGPVTKPLPTLSPAKPMPTVATTPTQALQPAQDAALALLSALRVQGPGPKSARGGAPSTTDAQTTFVLALLGCPDTAKAAEDSCFHLAHRTWHSAMVTLMSPRASLATIREQVGYSRLAHVPTDFCFLFNGHALDPNVEGTIEAADVAVTVAAPSLGATGATNAAGTTPQYIIMIDNVQCNIVPNGVLRSMALRASSAIAPGGAAQALLLCVGIGALFIVSCMGTAKCLQRADHRRLGREEYYNRVPSSERDQEASSLIDGADDKPPITAPATAAVVPCLPVPSKNVPCLRPLFKPRAKVIQIVKANFGPQERL